MKIYDISQPIYHGMPVWPGDTAFQERLTWQITDTCPVNVSEVIMSPHTGTHADAPYHYDQNGKSIGTVDLDAYIGRARVIDTIAIGPLVKPEHVEQALENIPERVLLRTYGQAPTTEWDSDFTAIDPETVELLAAHGVKLIGIDTPSVDPEQSKTLDSHMAIKKHGLAILEGLVLDGVAPGDYELIALPIKFANLDASPVRAILRSL